MVIDTVKDVVIGDVGDEIVSTAGVAVRPFWWSKESLEVLGVAAVGSGSDTTSASDTSASTSLTVVGGSAGTSTGGDDGGAGDDGGTAGEIDADDARSSKDESASSDGGLSGGWIAHS